MTDTATASPEEQLIDDIAMFTHDPLSYALYAFPWGEAGTELETAGGPRQWQAEALGEIGQHLRNPDTRHQPLLLARASGHGIGKSAFISMVIKWGMDTCEDCKVVVTANTENQLRTKTWPEIAKWQRLSITRDWFTCTKTAIYSNDQNHTNAWRADAVPWSENNTEAFAGLHNQGKRIILVFDEPNNVLENLSGGTYGMSAMFGAPPASRYQSRNGIGALFGPTFDLGGDIKNITSGVLNGEFDDREVRSVRKLLPFQNLFYLAPLLNQVEEQMK